MDFFELVDKRRSVRKFSNETIPKEVIIKALNAAVLAANSSNLQPWEFYWVKDKATRVKIDEAFFLCGNSSTIFEIATHGYNVFLNEFFVDKNNFIRTNDNFFITYNNVLELSKLSLEEIFSKKDKTKFFYSDKFSQGELRIS